MIVGTAGHIDHGKTTLVRALTGVDTDRLPEEKKRGISIELGYAFLDTPEGDRIGFIDAPGHERLVHTMLAGASGIDFALLLVAADDGIMPQTREHLAVLSLLGKTRGAVVITKADRADTGGIETLTAELQELLQHSSLTGAPVLAVSAQSGQGVDALRQLLVDASRALSSQDAGQAFRLAVDRSFSLGGTGTVVTGTIHTGQVQVGDQLQLVPSGHAVRVRSLHAQNQPVQQAHAGQRCAVALVGIDKEQAGRGDWLVEPAVALSTHRLDVRLSLWHAEEKALKSGARVQVHLGAESVPGTVAVLDQGSLQPGASALVQIVLHQPLGAWHGDRVVLRDASATRTMAGGVVLDPFAPVRYRRTPQRLAELAAWELPDPGQRLQALLELSAHGLDLRRFAQAQGLRSLPELPAGALQGEQAGTTWAMGEAAVQQAWDKVQQALSVFHEKQPDELGPVLSRLRRLSQPRMPEPLWELLVQRWRDEQRLAQQGAFLHLPEHGVRLSATEERLAEKVRPHLSQAGFEGAWARDLAKLTGEPEPLVRSTLARLARRGELHQAVKDLYYDAATMRALVQLARQVAQQHEGKVLAADYRDATGLGRKRAIQILEYLDRIGVLRRVGDTHLLRTDSSLFT